MRSKCSILKILENFIILKDQIVHLTFRVELLFGEYSEATNPWTFTFGEFLFDWG